MQTSSGGTLAYFDMTPVAVLDLLIVTLSCTWLHCSLSPWPKRDKANLNNQSVVREKVTSQQALWEGHQIGLC